MTPLAPMHTTLIFVLTITLLPWLPPVSARDTLLPGASLSVEDDSDVLRSPDGAFSCGFYNVSADAFAFAIWFTASADRTVVWTANPLQPVYGRGSTVTLQKHGALVLKNLDGAVVWTSNGTSSRSGGGAATAQLLDTGNLVVADTTGAILWQSFDHPTDTLLPYQPITANTKLVSFTSLLLPGRYTFRFSDEYILSLFYVDPDASKIYWPDPHFSIWDKQRKLFNGSRVGVLDGLGRFLGSDGLAFAASDMGAGVKRRLTLDYDGNIRLYSLGESGGRWSVTYTAFAHLYFVDGLCGVNGILVYSVSRPVCACPPGYDMADPSDWSRGCEPRFNLTCGGPEPEKALKFVELPFIDFAGPDMSVVEHVSLHACRNLCRSDCSCKAFRYVTGSGMCYTKPFLLTGKIFPWQFSSLYLKVPKNLNVSRDTIPHSGLPDPARTSTRVCQATTIKLVTHPPFDPDSSNGTKPWLYLYGFLSAFFAVEVFFVVFAWCFVLRREYRKSEVWAVEEGYRAVTRHFRRYTYVHAVFA